MNYSHIIFDWDGTLMDSSDKIVNCMQAAARLSDLPVPSASAVKEIIGISLRPAIEQLFGIDASYAEKVASHYKETFIGEDLTPCPLFPKVKSTLSELSRKYYLAVATGKARRGLERAWSNTNSRHFFMDSVCADEADSKPSPDMLQQLLNRWGIGPESALMIGDTVYDMQMAETLGMARIAVSFGVHEKHRLQAHKPLAIIDCISELNQLL